MRLILSIFILLISLQTKAQQVIQLKIQVNTDLKILSDVTADADSIPNGRYLVVYKNKTRVKGQTKFGKMSGIWTTYYANGQQKIKGRYIEGKPHGEWILWGIQGDVQAKFQYNQGQRIGHWQGYYYNHSKAIDIVFDPKGRPNQCIQYYYDDIIALNHEFSYDKKTTKATLSYYYKNFNLFHYEQLTNAKFDGSYIIYHTNGLIWEKFEYEKGRLEATSDLNTAGGRPRGNDNFRNGEGVLNRYYSNGDIYSKTTYKTGIKNDSISIYSTGNSGVGAIEIGYGQFKDGTPVGKWKIKDRKTLEFDENSKKVIETRSTSPAPKEKEIGPYVNGVKHGVWRRFDNYGEIQSEITYQYGLLNGVAKYYQSRKVMKEFNFSNGNKDGFFTYLNAFGKINVQDTFVAESTVDTAWFLPHKTDWITIENEKTEDHQKYLWFYPSLPGMEIIESIVSQTDQKEMLFEVKRDFEYTYGPELVPPHFDGDSENEKEYINAHLLIPKTAQGKMIDGTVMLRYKVDELGLISEVELLKTLGFGLDEAAINIIKALPPLNPATFNGLPIPCYVVREIDFTL